MVATATISDPRVEMLAGHLERFRRTVLGNRFIPQYPTAKQARFLLSPSREALYGGSAGGGKSSALLMAALQYVETPGYNALILRRTYRDLSLPEALIPRSHDWLQGTGAHWDKENHAWHFPSGATLTFGYLEHPNDKYRYQSSAYTFIGFDELTQFAESQYTYLFSRLRRLEGVNIPIRMRSGSNPGGVGHGWVYERFVVDDGTSDRVFIPARLGENPYLDAEDYKKSLAELDDITRAQLLEGLWVTDTRLHPFDRTWWEKGRNRFFVDDPGMKQLCIARYHSWDFAIKDGDENSYTANVVVDLLPDYRIAIRDAWRDKLTFPSLPDVVGDRVSAVEHGHKLEAIVIEDKASGTPVLQSLQRSAHPTIAKRLVAYPVQGSKQERWSRAAIWCKRGCVLLPHPSNLVPWLDPFMRELFEVPNSRFNDWADAFAQIIDYLSLYLAEGWHARQGAVIAARTANTGALEYGHSVNDS